MTHHDFDLSEVLSALQSDESGDLVRPIVTLLYQVLIDVEATEGVQGSRHERTITRTNQRNGFRTRLLTTTAGDAALKIATPRRDSGRLKRNSGVARGRTVPNTGSVITGVLAPSAPHGATSRTDYGQARPSFAVTSRLATRWSTCIPIGTTDLGNPVRSLVRGQRGGGYATIFQ